MSPIAQTLLKVLLSGSLLYFLIQKAQFAAIYRTILAVDLWYYLLAIGVYIIAQPIRSMRWWLLLKEKQVSISRTRLLILCFIGTFFSGFLPTIVGGDVVRGYYVFKESNAHDVSFASILVERLCGLVIIIDNGIRCESLFSDHAGPVPADNDMPGRLPAGARAHVQHVLPAFVQLPVTPASPGAEMGHSRKNK